MPLVVFAGAHLGYDSQKVPIGGGATVGHALIQCWAQTKPFELLVLGTGPLPPHPKVDYHRLDAATDGLLTDFSVSRYARMSRDFERAVTDFLAGFVKKENPEDVVVLHNDIAEAGDFRAIAQMGYKQAAIFHVDVVDYTARVYLRGWVSAARLARTWRKLEGLRLAPLAPAVLKLIFRKQEFCARFCDRLVVPSPGMAEVLRASYPWLREGRVLVIPWGTVLGPEPPGVGEVLAGLRRRYDPGERPVLLTLSRISPEKGQDLLLRALRLWDKHQTQELLLFICGQAAFMHGQSYLKKLRRLAKRLKRTEVIFPGHVGGALKHAFFRIADLYVFPSRHESYGLTLMEAMAAGLPVLTTNHRSAWDLVRPEFGRIVEPSPKALFFGLRELLCGRKELKTMGMAAQKFAQSRPFSLAADALAPHLLALISDKGAPPVGGRFRGPRRSSRC
ncbi:MAG: glycosyltransferase family 4 protein [Candidatus Bipolaricaulaceae bacterium]